MIPNLVFMRCNYTIAYLSNNTGAILGSQTAVMADPVGAPKQGHLSITQNLDEMVISYTTGIAREPSVRYVCFFFLLYWLYLLIEKQLWPLRE